MNLTHARVVTAAVSSALAGVSVALLAPTSQAVDIWTYTCDKIVKGKAVDADFESAVYTGTGNCKASNGAPASGKITKVFELVSRDNKRVGCAVEESYDENGHAVRFAGTASKEKVEAMECSSNE
ncbi:hypothetical protein ACFYO1_27325 [Nocardia sp. NPDC006044]|uniref:hypothetical protein n=1 Tax=Nocardia sp. NPDC006044 TaxID=3364306 RepID=UPI0036B3F8F8